MKRFTLTSPNIKGHIELIYNNNGILQRIDFAGATLDPKQTHNYKLRISVQAGNLYEAFKETGVIVEEKEFEVTFQDFRREYPYKRNTHLAEAHWPKMTSGNQYKAFVAAIEYRKYCERNEWYKPMIPDKWLKTEQYKNNWREL